MTKGDVTKGDDPARHANGAEARYWRSLSEGRLELPRCVGCGRWHWPAVWRCGDCGSWEQAWHEVAMRGTVFSWTRTWHAFAGAEALPLPYVSMVVELPQAGSLRLLGILEGDASALRLGAAVQGLAARTAFDGDSIPAIRWSLTGEAA